MEQVSQFSKDIRWQHLYLYPPYFEVPATLHWIQDHKRITTWHQQNHSSTIAQQQATLIATLPFLARLRSQNRLALLLVCRRMYLESWRLYYATNTFDFGALSSFTSCLRHIGPTRRAELSSIKLTFVGLEGDRLCVEEAVGYLAECRNMRYLHLRLCCNDRQLFSSLKTLRGCGKVDVTLGRRSWRSWNQFETYKWWLKDENRGIEGEVEEIKELLTRPKGEIGC